MTPDWPPIQVTVSCGLAPSVAHLRRTVCGALGGLSTDRAVLYKYSLQTCAWFELKPGLRVESAAGGAAAAGRPVSNVKRIENVFDPPYSLKEGDLLCAFEVPPQSLMLAALQSYMSTAPSASSSSAPICSTDFKTAAPTAVSSSDSSADVASNTVALSPLLSPPLSSLTATAGTLSAVTVIETAVSRPEDKHLRQLRQQEKLNKKAGVTGYRPLRSRKEVVLSIGGDLDFSDDESDEMMK